jgi:hypothetical protein
MRIDLVYEVVLVGKYSTSLLAEAIQTVPGGTVLAQKFDWYEWNVDFYFELPESQAKHFAGLWAYTVNRNPCIGSGLFCAIWSSPPYMLVMRGEDGQVFYRIQGNGYHGYRDLIKRLRSEQYSEKFKTSIKAMSKWQPC